MTKDKKAIINTVADERNKGEELFEAGEYILAVEHFKTAVKGGDTIAMRRLADCFLFGKGTDKDKAQAFELYTQAALLDDAEAQYILSIWYSDGVNQTADIQKALFWCFKAAAQGHSEAADYFLQLKGEDV